MIDIGPRLDSRLRAKFDRIDAEAPPQRLLAFRPTATRRRHRSLNVIVSVCAIAVVAAGIAAFAVELGGHAHPKPAPSSAQGGPLPKLPVYSPAPPSPTVITQVPMPVYGTGFPASWHIVIPVTKHTGSAVLPTFVPEGWEYIQYACTGIGHLQIVSTDGTVSESLRSCSSRARPVNAQISGGYGPLSEGRPVTLNVVTSRLRAVGDHRGRDRDALDSANAAALARERAGAGSFDLWKGNRLAAELHSPRVEPDAVVVFRSWRDTGIRLERKRKHGRVDMRRRPEWGRRDGPHYRAPRNARGRCHSSLHLGDPRLLAAGRFERVARHGRSSAASASSTQG